MPLYTLDTFFPNIDDPANIFFSKLRNIFTTSYIQNLHVKALSRVKREINLSILGMGRKIRKVYDIRYLKPEDEGKSLYLTFKMGRKTVSTSDTTTAGEEIPVKYYEYYLKNNRQKFSIEDHNETFLFNIQEDEENLDLDFDVLIKVGSIQKRKIPDFITSGSPLRLMQQGNQFDTLDLYGVDYKDYRLTNDGMYRNRIGWKWEITLNLSLDTSQPISFQQFASWKLYCIDSDLKETLIDDSSLHEGKGNYSRMWATQYGPSIDHPVQLYTYNTLVDNVLTLYVVERGYESFIGPSKTSTSLSAKMFYDTEPFCNTRGFVPEYFEYLFRGLKVSSGVKLEMAILIYSYIINMNIRYPLLSFKDDMFKVMDTIDMSTTASPKGFSVAGDNYYPYYMKTLAISGTYPYSSYSPYPNPDASGLNPCPPRPKSILSIVARDPYNAKPYVGATGNNLVTWYGNNHSLVSDILDTFIEVYGVTPPPSRNARSFVIPNVQNSLQSRAISFLRWYQRELVYLITFRRYYSALYKYGRNCWPSHALRRVEDTFSFNVPVIQTDCLRIYGPSYIDEYYTESGASLSTQILLLYGDIKYNSIMNFMVGCSQSITYSGGTTYEEKPL